jgi:hypothetical protein
MKINQLKIYLENMREASLQLFNLIILILIKN